MTTPNPSELFTPFLPATFVIPEDPERLRTYLNEKLSAISDVVNDKTIGAFTQSSEAINGNKYIYDTSKKVRNGYQSVARIKSWVPQTIPMPIQDVNPQFVIAQVWGSASKPCSKTGQGDGEYFSFFGAGDPRIQFTMTDTTITITTNGSTAAYQGFIFIVYVRDGV